eukprot:6182280-Pleurochrysis_carterae.AAC.2
MNVRDASRLVRRVDGVEGEHVDLAHRLAANLLDAQPARRAILRRWTASPPPHTTAAAHKGRGRAES